ncbi:two-component system, cell cycle sensor histidine kinase DivJ [Anaerolineae bacterium]|nr:two-component system, cell cycle sensor histidine kinase DivJ [Anaerolineae bacterium]
MDAALLIIAAVIVGIGIGAGSVLWWGTRRSQNLPQRDPSLEIPWEPTQELLSNLIKQSDEDALWETMSRWIHTEGHYPVIVAYAYEPALNTLHRPIVIGAELPLLPQQARVGALIYGQLAADVLRNRHGGRLVENVHRDPYFGPAAAGMNSAYVFALIHETVFYGVVGVQAIRPENFGAPAQAWLEHVGMLAAAQLARIRRTNEMRAALARFERFRELAQRLSARLSSSALLLEITKAAREMLDAQMSILLDVDETDQTLIPVAWAGISDETAAMMKTHFKGDLKGLVAWAQRPARAADLSTDQRTTLAREVMAAGMVSELAVPVLYFEELYGVLAVETNVHRHFSDEEMEILTALASQAAIALHNARQFENLQNVNHRLEDANAELVISRQTAETARIAAVQANRLKTEFINNMSHELRTPLNAVINFTRLVMEGFAGTVSEQQVNYLTFVHDSGQHLLGLINDILDLAKIEAGKLDLQKELTDLEPILKGVMSTAVGLTRSKGLELKIQIAPDLPLVEIDARRIRQVLLNIISNAAKFTLQGAITLRTETYHEKVVIAVQDTGVGMRPEDLSKIFEEFQQVDNPLQDAVSGTGLGMPISRRFIQLHGGDMWIESQVGKGTTVYFNLPIRSLPQPQTIYPQVEKSA